MNDPRPTKEMIAETAEVGISDRSLERARAALAVTTEQVVVEGQRLGRLALPAAPSAGV
jgi:hypothetical protein